MERDIAVMVGVCAAAVGALLVAERRESARGKWTAKPVASLAFVGAGLAAGAPPLVLAALALSLAGDLLLIPQRTFVAGLAAFLAAHLAYAAAFAGLGVSPALTALAAAPLAAAAVVVGRWLLPRVEPPLRAPVVAYMAVITAMVALAAGTRLPGIAGGALAFYLSDLSVARDRFVAPGFANRAWGLPLYYAAQLALAVYTAPPWR